MRMIERVRTWRGRPGGPVLWGVRSRDWQIGSRTDRLYVAWATRAARRRAQYRALAVGMVRVELAAADMFTTQVRGMQRALDALARAYAQPSPRDELRRV